MGIDKKKGFKLGKAATNIKSFKNTVPLKLANISKNHFLQGFRKSGGQTDASVGGWRKRKTARTARGRSRNSGRALLVRTGKMRADLKKREVSFRRIVVGIRSVDYAKYHNEGTKNMPKREIIGKSKVLDRKIKNKLAKEISKIW